MSKPISLSARHDFDEEIYAGETLADRVERETIEVIAMHGMGKGACGSNVLPEYIAGPGNYTFTWFLKTI